jgi:hypothetical protein
MTGGHMTDRGTAPTSRLAVLAAVAAIALAACSGGARSPHVASLGTSTTLASSSEISRSTSATAATTHPGRSNATELLDEWATCMHSHGDPDQADPTIDAYGVIHVSIPSGAGSLANEVHAGADPCNSYMAAAESVLRADYPPVPSWTNAENLKYVNCMRANGVPNYPYPQGSQTDFEGTGVDPNSPLVQRVNQLCGKKLGLPASMINGTGQPGEVEVGGGPNGGAGSRTPPPCFFAGTCPHGIAVGSSGQAGAISSGGAGGNSGPGSGG